MLPNLNVNESSDGGVMSDREGGTLYATVRGAGAPVILLHGLFGMGSNLGALARALEPAYEVHQLDLPNHGRSYWSARMDITEMADAVSRYIQQHLSGRVPRVAGHSLGGKVAMQLALSHPEQVAALVMADIAPLSYAASHANVFAAIGAVRDAPPSSRKDAATLMTAHVEEEGVRQFLLLSLKRDRDGLYRWRFNVEGLQENYAEMLRAPLGGPFLGPALSIYGALSAYVGATGEVATRALFPSAQFHVVADTGHWLHAEKPEAFNLQVLHFLKTAEQELAVRDDDTQAHKHPETETKGRAQL
ncbi:MAG: alpha/beta fold hydrolase [Congregibacter sp.]